VFALFGYDPEALKHPMPTQSYQQCSRCVMDTTDPEITFGEHGWCWHCTEFLNKRAKHNYHGKESDELLDKTIERIQRAGKGKEFDCVIGVSGGADSSYLTFIAREKGLRPLTVHLDNGWNSEKAVVNIKNITKKLGIDYESYVLDWEEFKDLQLSFLKASIPEAETPTDVAIPAALHRVASQNDIKYILSGSNLATEGILPKSWHYDVKDLKYFNHIHRTFGNTKLRKFPTFGYKREAFYKLIKGIQIVYPLNLVPFVKEEAIQLLEKEFAWQRYGGKHHESRYTKFIQSYYLFEKFGIDYRRAGLSVEICTGRITREAALEMLKAKPYNAAEIEEDKCYIAKKLGIEKCELERILSSPPKWYWDYPNDQRKLGFIYDTYRSIFKKEKLDRF
jgi:N-acetyl sugar amidotransferase